MAKDAKPVKSNEDRLLAIYDANLDDIEKEFNLAGSLNLPKFSSGILVYDLIIGGGYVPGAHYISTGKEGSAKSTACMTSVGEISRIDIPVAEYRDAENAVEGVYSAFCMGVKNLNEIFGERDTSNRWIIRPKVRYYDENVIETTFTSMVKTLNRLPDKRFRAADKTWYYIIDPKDKRIDKRFMEVLGKPDEKLKKLNKGLLWFPTDNSLPQAFFALDSYASMVSSSEEENEEQNNGLALEARDFAKSLRRLAGKMRRKAVTCQGVNQIRERPMVRFGCFAWHTRVLLDNGTTKSIGEIVQNRLKVKVMSYNFETKEFEPRKIVNWFDNGKATKGEYVKISYNRTTKGHTEIPYIVVTKNHLIFTPEGERNVGELQVGDYVFCKTAGKKLNNDQKQIVIGSILGDGQLSYQKNSLNIMYSHVKEQRNYLRWKLQYLNNSKFYRVGPKYRLSNGKQTYQTFGNSGDILANFIPESMKKIAKRKQIKFTRNFIKKIDLRALAVWYMDDGNFNKKGGQAGYCSIFYCQRFDNRTKRLLAARITQITGVETKIKHRGIFINRFVNNKLLHDSLAPYIHADMAYKVSLADMNIVSSYTWDKKLKKDELEKVEILNISQPNKTKRLVAKFDLEIEGNHNYVVGNVHGILVHNSPEYEPGGNALKHYSTCRNKFDARVVPQEWRGGDESSEFMREPSVYGKGKDTYMYKYIRNTKNKHATPRLDGWIRIWTRDNNGQGRGIDPVFDVAQFCVMTGLAEYNKERGTGRVVQFIKNKNADNLPKMLDALVKGGKSVPWQDFKKIVLSKRPFATRELKDEAEKLCKKLNVPHLSLFSNCQQFLVNGRANDAMHHTNASQVTKIKDLEA